MLAWPDINNETRWKAHSIALLMLIAFLFSMALRMSWVYQYDGFAPYMWNDQLMINTNDGYYWAEGARDILSGGHQPNDLSPVESAPAMVTAALAKMLPVSLDALILYLPAVLGSLIVVPVILTGRLLGMTSAGFIAALLASVVHSYYNRTMIGYYDTDMLNIVMPMFILWSMIFALREARNRYLLLPTAGVMLYSWWYPSSYALNVAMAGVLLGYVLLFERRNPFGYKLLAFFLIALASTAVSVKIALAALLFVLFHMLKERSIRYLEQGVFALAALFVFMTGGLDYIVELVKAYAFRGSDAPQESAAALHYYNVMRTVREAGHIPFEVFANRTSGHTVVFIAALTGYGMLLWRHRIFILSLPLFGLGMFAVWGGLRFTVYAVPVLALGVAFLIVMLSDRLRSRVSAFALALGATVAVLFPNVMHVFDYNKQVPSVLTAQEVEVLDILKRKASREDYVLAWWDYGYPIRYYADVKTLIDGGKHSGDVNFPVSFALNAPQRQSAVMARLNVEFTERAYREGKDNDYVAAMLEAYDAENLDMLMAMFEAGAASLPDASREVYFYLPLRMLHIFPTVQLFSNLDLQTGEEGASRFFYMTQYVKDEGKTISLGNNIVLLKEEGMLQVGAEKVPMQSFVRTYYDRDGKLHKDVQHLHPKGLHVVFMADYSRLLILDDKNFNSAYIQLFVMENYDKGLFEPVIISPASKVYRLKI